MTTYNEQAKYNWIVYKVFNRYIYIYINYTTTIILYQLYFVLIDINSILLIRLIVLLSIPIEDT